MLTVENVHKTYHISRKAIKVLQGVTLQASPGEKVAITGRSGAGKSTLLHILGGLDPPDRNEGRVLFGDVSIYDLSPRRRSIFRAQQVGFVFQSYHLLPEMDIVENVLLPAFAIGWPSGAGRRRALELLDQVGLSDRLAHTPKELSGGEQQRVALARALMNSPTLFLADEPTGNLDAGTGRQVLDLLFSLCCDRALILVTHDPAIASRCDRTLRLEDGRLE